MNSIKNRNFFLIYSIFAFIFIQSCSTFRYNTYDDEALKLQDDPEPNYNVTMSRDFQDFTTFMFVGNRIENFGTYFNTYYNATENFDDAYEEYVRRVLTVYSERLDSIFEKPPLGQEAIDKFNKAIEKASKVIQYHKSSQFMDKSVLLIGMCYFYLGDYLKAERKFSEFLSKLNESPLYEEAVLNMARTQLRLENYKTALAKLDELIANTKNNTILSGAYRSKAEYYLFIRDYENAILNFKKAIVYTDDSEFKAQMQYIVATVTERLDSKKAITEFKKVMDYGVTFDLEYLARYNYIKNLIVNKDFRRSITELEDLEVKYKDIPQYLSEVNYLKGYYFEQKDDIKKALNQYYYVILTFPSTKPSSDASYRIALYEENVKNDYLNAYRYYRFSTEQNNSGTFVAMASGKVKVFKNYFDLKSTITGVTINTDYDSTFRSKTSTVPLKNQDEEPGKIFEDKGKPGGIRELVDSVFESSMPGDTVKASQEKISEAKYELAELFLYDLNRPDSCEYYLKDALDGSDDYEFRSKVLYALSNLFRNEGNTSKADDILREIIEEYPSSEFALSSKRLLNIPADEEKLIDPAEQKYYYAEKFFLEKNYDSALAAYKDIIDNYPESKFKTNSLYAAGWIFENVLLNSDSAFTYYSQLISFDPNSRQAVLIYPKVEEYNLFINGASDSSSVQDTSGVTDPLNITDSSGIEIQPRENEGQPNNEGDINKLNKKKENDITPMKKEETDDGSGEIK